MGDLPKRLQQQGVGWLVVAPSFQVSPAARGTRACAHPLRPSVTAASGPEAATRRHAGRGCMPLGHAPPTVPFSPDDLILMLAFGLRLLAFPPCRSNSAWRASTVENNCAVG